MMMMMLAPNMNIIANNTSLSLDFYTYILRNIILLPTSKMCTF